MQLELLFPMRGSTTAPVDHAHALYGALKKVSPHLEDLENLGIHTLRGIPVPGGRILFRADKTLLRLRLAAQEIPLALPLTGKRINVAGSIFHLGAPEIHALEASPTLWARMVTLKFKDPSWDAARSQLQEELHKTAAEARWEIRRPRTIGIHGVQVLGFEVLARNLAPDLSLALQDKGVGGRRAFGCGLFVRIGNPPKA